MAQSDGGGFAEVNSFFEGTWKMDGKETFEKWEVSGDKGLKGTGYKLKEGEKKVSETLEIKSIDGNIFYIATVPNQNNGAGIKFKMTGTDKSEYVFENAAHDFPKKIIYKKLSPTEMFVQVLGDGGKGFSFKMTMIE